ncbi:MULTISPECIES: PqqD family peptide modification chaperone [unclassified Paludibacterium]|uniref:PqqD family peptide modification chaperone n=1 Tax=unclassified Paludibacterium TaxID=2618429 RepID=UPI001C0445B2|nr:PqqD family peptide modification chaperone [Paludibacterium sp. B53371]BEV73749.1 PqqD family protein [Paludibacterium sp. THUN1379]
MEHNNPLDVVYEIKAGLDYEIDDRRIVTILRKQDHWIQRFVRKLKFKIPAYRRTSLDDQASHAFLSIDGTRTVQEIGELMAARFGDQANPLYERLLMFLNHIEKNERFIVRKAVQQD